MTGQPQAPDVRDYLHHILEAIARVHRYTEGFTYPAFLQSTLAQDAVIRNLEIIGEASRNLERRFPDFVATHPELPVRAASDMRNALSHGYFGVDLEIVWRTIQTDPSALKQAVLPLLTA